MATDENYQTYEYQRNLQQQNIDAQHSLNAPYLLQSQQAVQAALVEQINPDRVLENIKLKLQGKIINNLTGEVVVEGQPFMNEQGIFSMISIASSVINQNTIMSALNEKQIAKIMIRLGIDITNDLTVNWRVYGITDRSKRDMIEDIILNLAYPCVQRALNGGERRFLGTTTIENISTAPRMPMQKKETFLSRFRF